MSKKKEPAPEPARPVAPELPEHRETPALLSAAWIVILLALIPLLMAAHGDGRAYLWTGLVMLTFGAVLFGLGKAQAMRSRRLG